MHRLSRKEIARFPFFQLGYGEVNQWDIAAPPISVAYFIVVLAKCWQITERDGISNGTVSGDLSLVGASA